MKENSMDRKDIQAIIENEELELNEKITEILNRHHVELNMAKENSAEKERADNLEAQLKETQKAFKAIKKDNQDNEALQEKISQSEAKIHELEQTLTDSKINSSIELLAVQYGAKNPAHIAKLIDRNQCGLDKNNQVYGVSEQLDKLKEDGAYLFDIKETTEAPTEQRQSYEPNIGSTKDSVALGANRALEIGKMRAQKNFGIPTNQET